MVFSHDQSLDDVAMGSNSDRDELEEQVRKLEEEVDDADKTLNEVYVTLCQASCQKILENNLHFVPLQKFTVTLLEHLHNCDSTNHNYNTAWYQSMCEGFQQILLEVRMIPTNKCNISVFTELQ